MSDYKLFKLMQVLTPKELLDIEKYLAAPFFNPTQDVLKLFVIACKFYPSFDNPKLTKERLFAKLYGKAPYDDGKMRKLMTQLTQCIERYLMQKELWKSEELQVRLLAKSVGDRDNFELFQATVAARIKTLENGKDRGRNYFREVYELSEMLFYHPGVGGFKHKDELLNNALLDFEQYFILVMLQNQADSIVRNRLVRTAQSSSLLQHAIQISQEPSFGLSESVPFFSKLVALLSGQLEMDVEQLRSDAFRAFEQLSLFERNLAINLLRNYAVPMANQGSMPHKRFVFELYKLEQDEGFFSNSIPPSAFMNMVAIGLSVGEFDWVEQFVDNYNHQIPRDEREITVNYCKGELNYHKGLQHHKLTDFYNALQFMNLIPIRTGPDFEVRVRPTILRIHFELFERGREDIEDFLNLIRNYERHLSASSEYSSSTKEFHLMFLRYLKQLVKIVGNPSKKQSVTLVDYLRKLENEASPIALKPWLIEKAKGLAQMS